MSLVVAFLAAESSSVGQESGEPQAATTDAALGYARQWLEVGDYTNAIGWYREILRSEPDNGPALFGLAEALRALGRNTEAKTWYSEYIKGPGRADALGYLGLALAVQQSGFHTLAIARLRRAHELDINNVDVMRSLAVSLRGRRQLAEARKFAEDAVRIAPDDHETYQVLALILADQGELAAAVDQANAAIRIVRAAIKADPTQASRLSTLYEYYGLLQTILQRQVESDPENAAVLNALSAAMQDRAHIEHTLRLYDALQVAMRAAEVAPRDIDTLLNLADLQEQLQLLNAAAGTYRDILALEPNHAFAKERAGRLPAPTTQPTTTAPAAPRSP